MIANAELHDLCKTFRESGGVVRLKISGTETINAVSIGKYPGGQYRRLGERGTGWMPPIQASERMRGALADPSSRPF